VNIKTDKVRAKYAFKWSLIYTAMALTPVVQLFAFLIAFPLFFIPEMRQTSEYMQVMFVYAYPRHWVVVVMYFLYYLIGFYIFRVPNRWQVLTIVVIFSADIIAGLPVLGWVSETLNRW